MFSLRFKRSAKRELLDLDDESFVRVVQAILALQDNPRPRGYDTVAGKSDQLRFWAVRDHRILYEVDAAGRKITIVAVRKKDEGTYR